MIRCVMMDLDGTLLRIKDQKTAGISDENEQALIRFEKAGGLTGIATSRSPSYIRHFSRRTWSAIVGWNGAAIQTADTLQLHPLPKQDIKQLWKTLAGDQPQNRVVMVTTDNDFRVYDLTFPLVRGYCENPLGLIQDHRRVVEWDSRSKHDSIAVIFAVYPDAPTAQAIRERLASTGLHGIWTSPRTLMITDKQVDKARGILEATVQLGLRKEEVAVIGDDFNDLTCFETFPASFCMASAEPEIQKQARWTVASVAEALALIQRENAAAKALNG